MVMLKDILGTKYIYDDYAVKLASVFETNKEVDLAGCKFTPKAESVLHRYYGQVQFINSTDSQLNELLAHNNGTKTARLADAEKLRLDFDSPAEFKTYLAGLDRHGNYFVDIQVAKVRQVAAVTVMTMMFSEMTIDAGYMLSEIFSFARREWMKTSRQHERYWLVESSSMIAMAVQGGFVKLHDGRVIKEEAFVQMYNVMPVDFGTRVLADDEEFRPVLTYALGILNEKQEVQRRMLDFLERRGQ